jgi:hypothetical protein
MSKHPMDSEKNNKPEREADLSKRRKSRCRFARNPRRRDRTSVFCGPRAETDT